MRNFIYSIFLIIALSANAQTNIFLGRDFWKTQPTIQQVKEKIAEGNNPTEMNQWNFDATVYAIISHAPTETIKFLTSIPGNDIDKSTHDGRNYLLWAGYAGDYELVKYLIEQGADVQWVDEHGFDIVTFTAVGGNTNPKLYELYKERGFNLAKSRRKGANALLIVAPSVKDIADLDYFIENGMNWSDEDDLGNNLFLSASTKGNIILLKQLIEKGVDYKKLNKKGENAILKAAQGARRHSNDFATFKFLNDLGLNPLIRGKDGDNVLHYLAYGNPKWEIYDYFLKKGADANVKNKEGKTPYMIAVEYDNTEVIPSLFEKTKNLDQQSDDGFTALTYAISNLNLSSTKALLDNHVDTNVTTKEGESLINILFKNYNAQKKNEFLNILELLTQHKVKPSINSKNGNTLYHIAVNKQEPFLADQAKKLGVNIDKMNTEGLTPLHLAAMKSTNLDMLKILNNFGANSRINTEFGEDAVVLALENELLDVTIKDLEFLNATNH